MGASIGLAILFIVVGVIIYKLKKSRAAAYEAEGEGDIR